MLGGPCGVKLLNSASLEHKVATDNIEKDGHGCLPIERYLGR